MCPDAKFANEKNEAQTSSRTCHGSITEMLPGETGTEISQCLSDITHSASASEWELSHCVCLGLNNLSSIYHLSICVSSISLSITYLSIHPHHLSSIYLSSSSIICQSSISINCVFYQSSIYLFIYLSSSSIIYHLSLSTMSSIICLSIIIIYYLSLSSIIYFFYQSSIYQSSSIFLFIYHLSMNRLSSVYHLTLIYVSSIYQSSIINLLSIISIYLSICLLQLY